MSYRHADHAGNFADVLKHAVTAFCVRHLTRKDKPFAVIDTHAGAGAYSLVEDERAEWRGGIGRLWKVEAPSDAAAFLAPYLEIVEAFSSGLTLEVYPGSPGIIADLSRPQDRMVFVERDSSVAAELSTLFGGDSRVRVELGDGYAALKSYLPPPERRGLVLVDPTHDDPDEMAAMAAAAKDAFERWPTGTFVFWRPLRDLWAAERFDVGLAEWLIAERELAAEKILRADLWVRELESDGSMVGAGVIVVNPPYGLEAGLLETLPWLAERLAQGEGAGWRLDGAITDDSLMVDEF
jgi:23S rRNA (adenine2030-N6)-methyltransferase